MAQYEYKCPGCGDVRVIERRITEPEETYMCNQCDTEFQRVFSSPTVVFNAKGFYSTGG